MLSRELWSRWVRACQPSAANRRYWERGLSDLAQVF